MDDAERASRYRQRAAEVRRIADGINDPDAKSVLLSIALDYEDMAQMLSKENDISDAPARALEALAVLNNSDKPN